MEELLLRILIGDNADVELGMPDIMEFLSEQQVLYVDIRAKTNTDFFIMKI